MKEEIIKKLDRCRELRGLPKQLSHRTFFEFGGFLQEMVDFLVFNKLSKEEDMRNFQKGLDTKKLDPEDFNTYVDLFLKYWSLEYWKTDRTELDKIINQKIWECERCGRKSYFEFGPHSTSKIANDYCNGKVRKVKWKDAW
jgi:hypothetical protein